jgi:hypothetical protein
VRKRCTPSRGVHQRGCDLRSINCAAKLAAVGFAAALLASIDEGATCWRDSECGSTGNGFAHANQSVSHSDIEPLG